MHGSHLRIVVGWQPRPVLPSNNSEQFEPVPVKRAGGMGSGDSSKRRIQMGLTCVGDRHYRGGRIDVRRQSKSLGCCCTFQALHIEVTYMQGMTNTRTLALDRLGLDGLMRCGFPQSFERLRTTLQSKKTGAQLKGEGGDLQQLRHVVGHDYFSNRIQLQLSGVE